MALASARRTRVGSLAAQHRPRISSILGATGVFRAEEINVALELFDETFSRDGRVSSTDADTDYAFVGAFTPDDELMGYACYGPTPDTDRTWDLYWIAVDPHVQGSGGGTQLLAEVERRLTRLDARMLIVETSSRLEYEPTRAFYQKRGYTEAARVREFYAPGDDRVIFTKRLREILSSPNGRGAVQQ